VYAELIAKLLDPTTELFGECVRACMGCRRCKQEAEDEPTNERTGMSLLRGIAQGNSF
jgi:hypothetical protein